MIVVVLGMHRSRTSMVAQMLHVLGVNMGDRLLGANQWNPWGHWEDLDFVELNMQILKAAGTDSSPSDWAHPPGRDKVEEAGRWFWPEAERLVGWKVRQGKDWGWKDPRTCLTWPVWWRVLERLGLMDELRVVHVVRDSAEVVESLMRRTREAGPMIQSWIDAGLLGEEDATGDREMQEWGEEEWWELLMYYEMSVEGALFDLGCLGPERKIETGGEWDRKRAVEVAVELAELVVVPDWQKVEEAAGVVKV